MEISKGSGETCHKHNLKLDYIDLSLQDEKVYKCEKCLEQAMKKNVTKLFGDQKQYESNYKKDIFNRKNLVMKLISYLCLNQQQQSQSLNTAQMDILAVMESISQCSPDVNVRQIKNVIFQKTFTNKMIQTYTFPINFNVTTNLIHMLNCFLIFGTQEGQLMVFDIQKNKIIIQQKLSNQGLVVVIKDPRRADYFFITGYDGNIIECQLKRRNQENNQSSKIKEKQGNNSILDKSFSSENKDELCLKQRRKFINKKQICRMIFCCDGKLIAAGVGKKIVLWNVQTGKVFTRLIGYHSSQVYGLENMVYGKYLLSISKGVINMFDLTKIDQPLVTQSKFKRQILITRIKKTSEFEFLVLGFPKIIAFFKIFEDKHFEQHEQQSNTQQQTTTTQNQSQQNSNTQMKQPINTTEFEDEQKLFSKIKSFKKLPVGQEMQIKNHKDISINTYKNYNIITTGEIILDPQLAYNLNVFDNDFINISGDYPYSLLINIQSYQNKTTLLSLEDAKQTDLSKTTILKQNNERVLTSLVLENITLQNQFYSNLVVNMPRNSQYEDEIDQFSQSLSLCFYV